MSNRSKAVFLFDHLHLAAHHNFDEVQLDDAELAEAEKAFLGS